MRAGGSIMALRSSRTLMKNLHLIRRKFINLNQLFIQMRCVSDASPKFVESYAHGPCDLPLLGLTLGDMLDYSAEKFSERPAIAVLYQGIKKNYKQLVEDVNKLSLGLLSLGLKKGDRIGMCSPSSYEWILTELAAAKAGLVLVSINPAFQIQELQYCLSKVECKAVIMAHQFKSQNYYKMLCDITQQSLAIDKPGQLNSERLPSLKNVIVITTENLPGVFTFQEVLKFGGSQKDLQDVQKFIQFDDPLQIVYTSGTTGYPKAATLSHHSVINNAYLTGQRLKYTTDFRTCSPVPMYHCFGSNVALLTNILYGCYHVIPSAHFSPEDVLAAIQNERCTCIYGTPTMFIDVLNHPNIKNYNVSSLKSAIIGGASITAELMKQILAVIPDCAIAYGSTETAPIAYMTQKSDPIEKRMNTVGKVMPYVEAKIIDDEGQIVPVNKNGEICVRGYMNMLGYWEDEIRTKEAISAARWYKTGDIGSMDEDGYVKVTGRIKDLIIRGGANIYPTEIERFLITHSSIEEVQVCGVPDERMGEEVCAWIRIKQGMNLTEKEVKDFCKGKIAHFKIPRYILFTKEFPLTSSNKIYKSAMKERSIDMLNLKKK